MKRRRTSVGGRGRRRIRAGGPRATGRPAASVAEWELIRDRVLARARWACQACGVRTGLEVHHVIKRSQGGSDFDWDSLAVLCARCHARTGAPYASGRLVVTALGGGQFECTVVQGASKWDTAGINLTPAVAMGRGLTLADGQRLFTHVGKTDIARSLRRWGAGGLPTWAN